MRLTRVVALVLPVVLAGVGTAAEGAGSRGDGTPPAAAGPASASPAASGGASAVAPAAAPAMRTAVASGRRVLRQPRHGARALHALGRDVAVTARLSGLSVRQVRHELRTDHTMWVARDGELFAKERPWTSATGSAAAAAVPQAAPTAAATIIASGTPTPSPAPYPLGQTFALHSLPGSAHTLFLNFGPTTLPATSDWVLDGTTVAGPISGWDPAGDGDTTFSATERAAVQEIWERVAEDYAPFDVDVTTQAPTRDALLRTGAGDATYGTEVDVTDDAATWSHFCAQLCGGLAFIGTIAQVDPTGDHQHAYVFPGGAGGDDRGIADAASHEAGHTFGLTHQGDLPDTTLASYDEGHGIWSPIMGSGGIHPVTQWAKGEYAGANNHQDELAVIEQAAPARADEAGGTPVSAATLPASGAATGYITSQQDVDTYALGACLPTAVDALPAPVGPDLDVNLSLVDSTGAVVASNDPADTADTVLIPTTPPGTYLVDLGPAKGMDAHIAAPMGGTAPYYVVVRGGGGEDGGAGNPVTDFDAYGSVGGYSLSVSGCGGSVASSPSSAPPSSAPPSPVRTTPPAPAYTVPGAVTTLGAKPGRKGGRTTVIFTWSAPAATGGTPLTGYRVTVWKVAKHRARATKTLSSAGTSVEVRLKAAKGVRYAASVQAVNAVGAGPASGRSRAVRPR